MQVTCRGIFALAVMMVVVNLTGYAADPNKSEQEAWQEMISSSAHMAMAGRSGHITIHNTLTKPIKVHLAGKNLCKVISVKAGWVQMDVYKSETITIDAGEKKTLDYYARKTGGVKIPLKAPLSSEEVVDVNRVSEFELNMIAPKLVWEIVGQDSVVVEENLSEEYKKAYDMNVSIAAAVNVEAIPDKDWSNWKRVALSRKHLARLIEAKRGVNAPKEVIDALVAYNNEYYAKSQAHFKTHWFKKD